MGQQMRRGAHSGLRIEDRRHELDIRELDEVACNDGLVAERLAVERHARRGAVIIAHLQGRAGLCLKHFHLHATAALAHPRRMSPSPLAGPL